MARFKRGAFTHGVPVQRTWDVQPLCHARSSPTRRRSPSSPAAGRSCGSAHAVSLLQPQSAGGHPALFAPASRPVHSGNLVSWLAAANHVNAAPSPTSRLCASFSFHGNRRQFCQIEYLPVYVPSEEEVQNPNLYATNVRKVRWPNKAGTGRTQLHRRAQVASQLTSTVDRLGAR